VALEQLEAPPIAGQVAQPAAAQVPRVQLEHWHVRSTCDPNKGTCAPATSFSRMSPAAMNPGFIDPATDTLRLGTDPASLQSRLANLLLTRHSSLLSARSRQLKQATTNDRLRVALVDLSGRKLADPELAGWGSTFAMQGASTTKIAILYSIHQLRCDVAREAMHGTITDGATLVSTVEAKWRTAGLSTMPRVTTLFDLQERAPLPVRVSLRAATIDEIRRAFKDNNNVAISRLAIRVGMPYIASILVQSGLYHLQRGGLWFSSSYGCDTALVTTAGTAEYRSLQCTRADRQVTGKVVWRHDPLAGGTLRQNATALAVASYFTLMAQGRLGGPVASGQIKTTLLDACSYFWTDSTARRLAGAGTPPTKCGVVTVSGTRFRHDVALIERGQKRYVAVALSRGGSASQFENLIMDLDGLI
jgi:hypothetical protein